MKKILLTISLIFSSFYMYSDDCLPMFHGPVVSLGPEYTYLTRTREGGTKQNGSVYGGRINFDYIKRYNFYIGGQAYYGGGNLNGHTSTGNKIRSHLIDAQIEGSIGYTFQAKCWNQPWFTPILGYGYFYESNKFVNPSPLILKSTIKYSYIPFGFLSGIMITPCLSLGVNLRIHYPFEPKNHITDDPDFEDLTQRIGEKFGYRVEVPFVYKTNLFCQSLLIQVMPFYDERTYGGRLNYPFDFFKTTFRGYGTNIQVMYQF